MTGVVLDADHFPSSPTIPPIFCPTLAAGGAQSGMDVVVAIGRRRRCRRCPGTRRCCCCSGGSPTAPGPWMQAGAGAGVAIIAYHNAVSVQLRLLGIFSITVAVLLSI